MQTASELTHHGVKGMKWGVRKSKTSNSVKTVSKRQAKKQAKKAARAEVYQKPRKKFKGGDARKLTDKELKKRSDRLQKEKTYNQLVKDVDKSKSASLGKTIVKDSLKMVGTSTLSAVILYGAAYAINKKIGDGVVPIKTKGVKFPGVN